MLGEWIIRHVGVKFGSCDGLQAQYYVMIAQDSEGKRKN